MYSISFARFIPLSLDFTKLNFGITKSNSGFIFIYFGNLS